MESGNQDKSIPDVQTTVGPEAGDHLRMAKLLAFAQDHGATRVASLSPAAIRIEDRLAAFCRSPKCPHYGMAMSCPPHVGGPEAMRGLIANCRHAIVLRMEVDGDSLTGEQRPEVMRLLHELCAAVELEAIRLGFAGARAFAGGSCKMSFCAEQEQCRVLAGEGNCRYPDAARPSMSGFGVNVGALMQTAGWSTSLFAPPAEEGDSQLSWVAGLVLLP